MGLKTNLFFFSSRRRHTRWTGDWSSDVCSSDLMPMKTSYSTQRSQNGSNSGSANDRGPRKPGDRKSTRLNSSHPSISYAVFCLKKKKKKTKKNQKTNNTRTKKKQTHDEEKTQHH